MNISLLPTTSCLNADGIFDLQNALLLCGQIGGICYSPSGYENLKREEKSVTSRRVDLTLRLGHHSIFDHVQISLEISGIPKILAMILNNEKQYTTSEKSARYTHFVVSKDSPTSEIEVLLYEKWIPLFEEMILEQYPGIEEKKRKKLALENARYFISVFAPTNMVYTVPLGQLNRIAGWLTDYSSKNKDPFSKRLNPTIRDFVNNLKALNLIESRLQTNEKARNLSLFASEEKSLHFYESFDFTYSVKYLGSFAQLAQAHRHRTISYQMVIPEDFYAFVPPILTKYPEKRASWLADMDCVKSIYPQGQMVQIFEQGTVEMFVLKCKERLCTAAQQEIMIQTSKTLKKYIKRTEENKNTLYKDLLEYSKGARCTFPDYICQNPCHFKEGVNLTRLI